MEPRPEKAARWDFTKLDEPRVEPVWKAGVRFFVIFFLLAVLFYGAFALVRDGRAGLTSNVLLDALVLAVMMALGFTGLQRLSSASYGLTGVVRARQSATVAMSAEAAVRALGHLGEAVRSRSSLSVIDTDGEGVSFEHRLAPVPIRAFATPEGVRVQSTPRLRWLPWSTDAAMDEGRTLREVQWTVSILEESVDPDRSAKTA